MGYCFNYYRSIDVDLTCDECGHEVNDQRAYLDFDDDGRMELNLSECDLTDRTLNEANFFRYYDMRYGHDIHLCEDCYTARQAEEPDEEELDEEGMYDDENLLLRKYIARLSRGNLLSA